MKNTWFIFNARLVNEDEIFRGCLFIKDGVIEKIYRLKEDDPYPHSPDNCPILDAKNKFLIPGVIDDQVHFREPGLTHKGDICSESKAAVAGGVTSWMEMPNTIPNTLTQELLEEKYQIAEKTSLANYSFYMGASNENITEVLMTNPRNVCGVKVFMGASTGNMLVDNIDTLNAIFSKSKLLIATHCEDETTIQTNANLFRERYGENIPIEAHPLIRNDEACYKSSKLAVGLARIYGTRLHVLHLSTAKEMLLFENKLPLSRKKITTEVCIHHLWFNNTDYPEKGTYIKWNPSIKTREDQQALWNALLDNTLDVVATDHAPHTVEEKTNNYFRAPSGGPLVQHSLLAMIDFYMMGKISLEKVIDKMCHAPAICFQVEKRGFIREGYWADLTIIDPDRNTIVSPSTVLYKCGWSPFNGHVFGSRVTNTFVNGNLVYDNGVFNETIKGQRLLFEK